MNVAVTITRMVAYRSVLPHELIWEIKSSNIKYKNSSSLAHNDFYETWLLKQSWSFLRKIVVSDGIMHHHWIKS